MARRNLYEMNYARLEELIGPPDALVGERSYRFRADHFMDLVVERLPACPHTGAVVLSLAHYFEQDGDLCQDPEMTLRVFPPGENRFREFVPSTDPRHGRVEALTFQQAIPPIYHEVYSAPDRVFPRLKRDLNSFLATWLRNLKDQGHRLVEDD